MILAGCPVLLRDWVLPDWFDHLDTAATIAGVDLEFVFVGGAWDEATWAAIDQGAAGRPVHQVIVDEPRRTRARSWTRDDAGRSDPHRRRYHRMVELRNALLARVREVAPPAFLSLDSDILLHPNALADVIETQAAHDHAAVAAAVDLRPGVPNYFRASLMGGYMRPAVGPVTVGVDVIMAAKLMAPAGYHVDYRWHRQGEDIGWSEAVRAAGGTLGWDGRSPSRHVADPPADLLR